MTEAEWLACAEPMPMLGFLRRKASDRKLRLLGCGCCRQVWAVLPDAPTRQIVIAVERFVDGQETPATIGKLRKQATRADTSYLHPYELAVRKASVESTGRVLSGAAWLRSNEDGKGIRVEKRLAESVIQTSIIRDIFGNPFRSVPFAPSWRTSAAVALAASMYDGRDFAAMPVLADALQEAGCENPDVLNHSRGGGPHVRGCWVVDLVLGKT